VTFGLQVALVHQRVEPRYHASPSENRESILDYGLDWTLMHPERSGIANGPPGQPETEGIFLTHPFIEDARFFVRMGATQQGQSIDVWRVDVTDLILDDLTDEGGWWLCRAPIPPERVKLVEVWATPPGTSEPQRTALPRLPRRQASRRRTKRRG
jgi:hypothetical protein